MGIASRTEPARGREAQVIGNRDYRHGDVVNLNGEGVTPVVYTPAVTDGHVKITTTGATVNDVDLGDGEHGQEVLVEAVDVTGGNATLTENAGTTIVQQDGGTVASITFDAAGEYALLRFEYNQWRLMVTNATIAAV